jgi:hypothetical protein
MLCDQVPLRVIHAEVEVCDSDFHSPVLLVVELHMPVNSYRAHVGSALDKRLASPFARTVNCRL